MYETNIVVVGNVLTAPEWRRIGNNTLVANFRVASTSRWQDRERGRWVDGNHLRVRVSCWRRLAENVGASVTVGDPVVVVGRLFTRDWTDGEGNLRTSYELEASSVGHDLSRGKGRFFRTRHAAAISETDDLDTSGQVRGEHTEMVTESDAPVVYGEGLPDEGEPQFVEGPMPGLDPVAALMGRLGLPRAEAADDPDPLDPIDPLDAEEPARSESPAEPDEEPEVEEEAQAGRRRPRRNARREPVPA